MIASVSFDRLGTRNIPVHAASQDVLQERGEYDYQDHAWFLL